MHLTMLGRLLVVYYALFLPRCSTEVDVGDNAKLAREKKLRLQANDSNAIGIDEQSGSISEGTINSSPSRSKSDRNAPSAHVEGASCFGQTNEPDEDLVVFCKNLDEDLHKKFKNILGPICDDHMYHKLLMKSCGWKGREEDQDSYIGIPAETAINSNKDGTDYYNFTVYSVHQKVSKNLYPTLVVEELMNPQRFKSKFKPTPFVEVKSEKGDSFDLNEVLLKYRYNYRLSAMARVFSFDSQMLIFKVSDNTRIIIDYATDNFKGVKLRNHVSIMRLQDDGSQNVIVLEERIATDIRQYIRGIVKSMLITADKFRMSAVFSNLAVQ